MRAGNREVNIFNMSLLDILCGALGAFCFLTITLFPYYRPDASKLSASSRQSVEQMEKQIEQLKREIEKGGGAGAAAALEQLKQMQGQLAALQAELDKYRQALDQAEKRAAKYEIRRPLAVVAHWPGERDIDLYLQDSTGKMAAPDPARRQWPYWNGDVAFDRGKSPGYEVWMNRDLPQGVYKVFVKLMGTPPPGETTWVWLSAMYESDVINFGDVTLTASNRMVHAVDIAVSRDGRLSFHPQSALRAADDLKKRMAAAVPPAGR